MVSGYPAGGGFAGSIVGWRNAVWPVRGGASPAAAGDVERSMSEPSRRDPVSFWEVIVGPSELAGCVFELVGCLLVAAVVVGAAGWFFLQHCRI